MVMNKWVSPLTGQMVEYEVYQAHAQELREVQAQLDTISIVSESDMVAHPSHYRGSDGTEVIDVLRAFGLDKSFELGSAVKYLLRSERKGNKVQDIRKAKQMLELWLAENEKESN